MPSPAAVEPEETDADTEFYRALLHNILDLGADLGRVLRLKARAQIETLECPAIPADTGAPPAERAPEDHTVAYARLARAMRQTILLAQRLDDPRPAPTPPNAFTDADRARARARILRDVEDHIVRHAKAGDAETLQAELHERLARPEIEDDIAGRPVAQIVADIVRDLGVAGVDKYWKRRAPDALAELCARAAQPFTRPPAANQDTDPALFPTRRAAADDG